MDKFQELLDKAKPIDIIIQPSETIGVEWKWSHPKLDDEFGYSTYPKGYFIYKLENGGFLVKYGIPPYDNIFERFKTSLDAKEFCRKHYENLLAMGDTKI